MQGNAKTAPPRARRWYIYALTAAAAPARRGGTTEAGEPGLMSIDCVARRGRRMWQAAVLAAPLLSGCATAPEARIAVSLPGVTLVLDRGLPALRVELPLPLPGPAEPGRPLPGSGDAAPVPPEDSPLR